LGGHYRGECRAPSHPAEGGESGGEHPAASLLSDEHLEHHCNHGYAREECPRHPPPAAGVPDAYRFTVVREQANELTLRYVTEREHYPATSGEVLYQIKESKLFPSLEPATLERQAQCYVATYFRRKRQTGAAAQGQPLAAAVTGG
jgi:hypothetical protein